MTALWREMLAASDAALANPDGAATEDGAITAAHIRVFHHWLADRRYHSKQEILLALRAEIRAARNYSNTNKQP